MTRDEIIKALRCKASKAEQRNCDRCRLEDGCIGCINEYIGAAAAMLEADARQEEPKTNADKIRAMSDEGIAKILVDASTGCPPEIDWDCCINEYGWDGCEGCWMMWLRQPTETSTEGTANGKTS